MNLKDREAVKSIADSITKVVAKAPEFLPFDRSIKGEITEVLGNGKYKVEIDKKIYTTYSPTDMVFAVREKVWIIAPNNNLNDKYILGRRK